MSMSQTETPFLGGRAARKAFEAKQILDLAEDAGREPTFDERARVKQLLDDAKLDHETETKLTQLGRELGAPEIVPDSPFGLTALTPGERFTKSPGYRSIVGNRG